MREIVSQYDMTDITPNDFSTMIQQLYAKNAVSAKDMQELSSIRADLESAGVGADQSVNLQEFYQQRLAKAKADAAQSPDPVAAQANIQSIAARMTWVEKFAADTPAGHFRGRERRGVSTECDIVDERKPVYNRNIGIVFER